MKIPKENSVIKLDFIHQGLTLEIISEGLNDLFEIEENESLENGEANHQIVEGRSYYFEFSEEEFRLNSSIKGIIYETKNKEFRGRITPNIYVGTLQLEICSILSPEKKDKFLIEVLASKFNTDYDKSYRQNYRTMLESITEKCTDLLMQINSPVVQNYETEYNENSETTYQRFCFVSSLINSKEFEESILKITSSPKTSWASELELSDIRKIKRFSNHEIKQLNAYSNRTPLPANHFLQSKGLQSIPSKVFSSKKIETIDNAENRFIKHALEVYLSFCENCNEKFQNNTREKKECEIVINRLELFLNQPFFREISRPTTLKLNSPVLQRKSGYREILKTWLMFDLAAKLIWKGGDDVYAAGKRDIATLYEYWLFFTLYDLFRQKFQFNQIQHDNQLYDNLIEPTKDGLNVILKSGTHTALIGVFKTKNRELNIKFSYNKTFKGGKIFKDHKGEGSWTTSLRPDYTLSIWPKEFSDTTAEENELIVHIHFDAKYKVEQFNVNSGNIDFEEEIEERKGNYKNADLLKMHAYKDAIRRTGGAYILYPGTKEKELRGFHEIIPGLGAFAINPSEEAVGIKNLSDFVDKVIDHLLDRASQREHLSAKIYDIHKEPKEDKNILNEPMPEYLNNHKLIPDEAHVLIGYYKSEEHLNWILKNNKYNFRTGTNNGSLPLNNENTNAKYLVLHGENELNTRKIYELCSEGPKIFSKKDLENKKYPNPTGELYLVYTIVKDVSFDFKNIEFDLHKIPDFKPNRSSAKPLTSTLKNLLMAKK
jgi:predicted component of viral defense system (DUF524 family)